MSECWRRAFLSVLSDSAVGFWYRLVRLLYSCRAAALPGTPSHADAEAPNTSDMSPQHDTPRQFLPSLPDARLLYRADCTEPCRRHRGRAPRASLCYFWAYSVSRKKSGDFRMPWRNNGRELIRGRRGAGIPILIIFHRHGRSCTKPSSLQQGRIMRKWREIIKRDFTICGSPCKSADQMLCRDDSFCTHPQ